MKLTSRERLNRIFERKEIDRPAIKLWGAKIHSPSSSYMHPDYASVGKLAYEKSDLFLEAKSDFDILGGSRINEFIETYTEDTTNPTLKDLHIILHTPKGDLSMCKRCSVVGEPSYRIEHFIKEPEDIEKILSVPYEPYPIDTTQFYESEAALGDKGVTMFSLDNVGYTLNKLLGSEALAYFSIDYRDELMQLADVYASRIYDHTKAVLDTGIKAPFCWVGPEVLIPPLMAPDDFEDFCFRVDKPLCDLIHDNGGYVWVHSHGKVANFVDRFIDMGVDVLNPLEPQPNGDIHLGQIIEKFGNRIGWEGNIEIQEILLSSPERVKSLIDECVSLGWESGRFILCPSAGYQEYVNPTKQYIENLLVYLQYGYDAVEACRR